MTSLLYFLIPLTVLAVVVVLVTGVTGFIRNGRFNRNYGNKLMQARILLQFIAIMLILLLVTVIGTGK
jgi:hypothetical protein